MKATSRKPYYIQSKRSFFARLIGAAIVGAALAVIPASLGTAQTADVVLEGDALNQFDSLQERADTVKADLDELDRNLEQVVEEHNATRIRLDELTGQLADSRVQLDRARAQHSAQQDQMAERLVAVYKADDVNIFSIVLNSDSFSDLYNQIQYISKVSDQDAKLEAQLKESEKEIEQITNYIDQQRAEQMRLEDELGQQEETINSKIQERQAAFDAIDAEVQQVIQQELERQRSEREQTAADAADLLAELNITDEVQSQVVTTALQYLGVPYVWGGESPNGFDCSGLTKYVFAQHGVDLPHYAASQFDLGVPVPQDELQPGDLVFWGPGHPHHVGMYIGKGLFIEAPNFNEVVCVSPMDFGSDYAGARRYPLMAAAAAA